MALKFKAIFIRRKNTANLKYPGYKENLNRHNLSWIQTEMRGERTQQGNGEEPSFLFAGFPLSAPDLLMFLSQSGEI